MAEFTPIQQARRNALSAFIALLKMEHDLLSMDYTENAHVPEAVSDEEWVFLVREIGRSRLTFITENIQLMLNDPQKYADKTHTLMVAAARDIAEPFRAYQAMSREMGYWRLNP